jgi:hypothetical protein
VDALNNALDPFGPSLFAVSGAFQDLPPFSKVANQYIFQRSNASDVRQLTITYTVDPPGQVPEPATLGLTGGALLMAGLLRRRNRGAQPES